MPTVAQQEFIWYGRPLLMKKKVFLFSIVLISIIGFFLYRWIKGIERKIFVSAPAITGAVIPRTIAQKLSEQTPFSILLLGYGGGTHDGTYLTDSMMLVNIQPKAHTVSLISIPRDLMVHIPTNTTGGADHKINAAYMIGLSDKNYPDKPAQFRGEDGGGRLAEYMVSQVLGVPVEQFVGVDFSGFIKTIDTLGGVTVQVDRTFDDFQYPIEGKETDSCGHSDDDIKTYTATASADFSIQDNLFFPCRYEQLHVDAGPQHLDGATALKYVRSRHSAQDGSDFGRAKRQRNVLVAVKREVFSLGFVPKILPFVTSLGDDVRTDVSPDDVRALIGHAKELNGYTIQTYALTDQNYLMEGFSADGQSILLPRAGQNNYTSIHPWIADTVSGKPQPVDPVVLVKNGTTLAGLAATATRNIRSLNITVLPPSSTKDQQTKTTTITVFAPAINPDSLHQLQQEFGVTTVTQGTAEPGQQYTVLITLGSDYGEKIRKNARAGSG